MKSTVFSLLALAATSFGLTIPSVSERSDTGISAIAAVNTSSTVLVFSQDQTGSLMMSTSDTWDRRHMFGQLVEPKLGSAISAIGKNDTDIRIYYVGTDNLLKEAWRDPAGDWQVGQLVGLNLAVNPNSQVSATFVAGTGSNTVIRVYAQLEDNSIQEYNWDGYWYTGRNFGQALPGTAISSTSWLFHEEPCIRVYYQDASNDVVENCLDGTNSYTGQFVQAALPSTPISALSFGDTHIRVYFARADSSMAEVAWDGPSWYTGQWTDSYTPGTQISAFGINDSNEGAGPSTWTDGDVQLRVLLNRNQACSLEEWQYSNGAWTR